MIFYDENAEQAALGSCLIGGWPTLDELQEIIPDPTFFYREAHKELYRALLDMASRKEPIDLVTLQGELKKRNTLDEIGGIAYLTELADIVPTPANVRYYAGIVRKNALARLKFKQCQTVQERLEVGEDPETVISTVIKEDSELLTAGNKPQARHIKEILFDVMDELDERRVNQGITGLATGFSDLDQRTGGLRRGEVSLLASRPKMGKTTLALNIARNTALAGKTTLFLSLEMTAGQLVEKLLAAEAGIDSKLLQNTNLLGDSAWKRITRASVKIANARLFIDDTAQVKASELLIKLRRFKALYGLDLLIVDYLQLLQPETRRETRNAEVTETSRQLKLLAKDLNIPVLALSQLSRAVDNRKDNIPQPSDLRESGALEQDAALVMFLYRDDYYHPENYPPGHNPSEVDLIISLNRFGPAGTVKFYFDKARSQFFLATKRELSPA